MAQNVFFKRGSELPTSPLMTTFYLINDTDLYIGNKKLSNEADLKAAIARITNNEDDIEDLQKSFKALLGEGSEGASSITGMIEKAVGAAKEELQKSIDANTSAIATETTRAKDAEKANTKAVGDEKTRAETAEGLLSGRIDAIEGNYYLKKDGEALATKVVENETTLTAVKADVDAFFKGALGDSEAEQVKDTLKEIQDYINSDTTGAAEMAASIKQNKDAIDAINNETTGILAQAKADSTAKAESVLNESKRYTNTKIDIVETTLETLSNTVEGKADGSIVQELSNKVTTAEGNIQILQNNLSTVTNQTSANASAIGILQEKFTNLGELKLGTAAAKDVEYFETPAGAQTKADTVYSNAVTYIDTALTWNTI